MYTLNHTDHAGITIHHHSDWLGIVCVTYEGPDATCQWAVDSSVLLSGKISAPVNARGEPVPVEIVAQAVAMAVRAKLCYEIVCFAEERC